MPINKYLDAPPILHYRRPGGGQRHVEVPSVPPAAVSNPLKLAAHLLKRVYFSGGIGPVEAAVLQAVTKKDLDPDSNLLTIGLIIFYQDQGLVTSWSCQRLETEQLAKLQQIITHAAKVALRLKSMADARRRPEIELEWLEERGQTIDKFWAEVQALKAIAEAAAKESLAMASTSTGEHATAAQRHELYQQQMELLNAAREKNDHATVIAICRHLLRLYPGDERVSFILYRTSWATAEYRNGYLQSLDPDHYKYDLPSASIKKPAPGSGRQVKIYRVGPTDYTPPPPAPAEPATKELVVIKPPEPKYKSSHAPEYRRKKRKLVIELIAKHDGELTPEVRRAHRSLIITSYFHRLFSGGTKQAASLAIRIAAGEFTIDQALDALAEADLSPGSPIPLFKGAEAIAKTEAAAAPKPTAPRPQPTGEELAALRQQVVDYLIAHPEQKAGQLPWEIRRLITVRKVFPSITVAREAARALNPMFEIGAIGHRRLRPSSPAYKRDYRRRLLELLIANHLRLTGAVRLANRKLLITSGRNRVFPRGLEQAKEIAGRIMRREIDLERALNDLAAADTAPNLPEQPAPPSPTPPVRAKSSAGPSLANITLVFTTIGAISAAQLIIQAHDRGLYTPAMDTLLREISSKLQEMLGRARAHRDPRTQSLSQILDKLAAAFPA